MLRMPQDHKNLVEKEFLVKIWMMETMEMG
jgi:hypothetical protein